MIVDYQVVVIGTGGVFKAPKDLPINKKVNELISAGWQPLGGVAVQGAIYIQAMVKYEN